MNIGKGLLAAFTLAGLSLGAGSANAALVIVSSVGGAPNVPGVTKWNLDAPLVFPSKVASLTLVGSAGLVTGSVSGQYAAPYLSGDNGTGFGPGGTNQGNGLDATQYVTSGSTNANSNSRAEIAFNTSMQYLGLLWGSVDTYNTLTFFLGSANVGSITGGQVTPSATGDRGLNGTFYVNINSTQPFNRVVFSSSSFAFEFDNVAFAETPINPVPIPAAGWLLVSGLLGLLGVSRRRAAG